MKKVILIFILFSVSTQCNNLEQQLETHLKDLTKLSSTADLLFAQILALQLGNQFNSNASGDLNNDLLFAGRNLRFEIQKTYENFVKNFTTNPSG